MKPKITRCLAFSNGNLACFDDAKQQVPELQLNLIELWAEKAEKLGYNPDGTIFQTNAGDWILFKTETGWNYKKYTKTTF